MNDSLFLILVSIITIVIGFALGRLFSGLKHKETLSRIEERNNQLSFQIEDLKSQLSNNSQKHKEELLEFKNSRAIQLEKIEKEREEIRSKKDILSTQLTERNSEYKNLQEKLLEQKEELEKLQEKFSKEFENLANKILDQKSAKFTTHQ